MLNPRYFRLLAAVACAALFGVDPANAAGGKITGTVSDALTGYPLPDANVLLVETEAGTETDSKGRFFLLNVAPGIYTLRATFVGYRPVTMEGVRVSADLTTDLEFVLGTEAIEVEEVVIQAERPIIDKNATNAVRIVEAEDIEILPGRGLGSVINLQPGVVIDEGALHIRGSRSDEVGFYIDGTSVRNPVSGTSAISLIDEALQEIQLQAGGFNAEYGGANAGIILQEMRTGAPDWEVGFLTETDNFTSKYEERFGTYSYGYSSQVLTLSGPVAKRVRAFLAGQRRVQDSVPTYWEGFEFEDLVDSGDRGGRIHWREDEDGNAIPDTVDLRLQPGNIDHTGSERLTFNGTLLVDLQPFQLRLTSLYSALEGERNGAPVYSMLNTGRLSEWERTSSLHNLKAIHFLDPRTFYEVNLSLYNQDRKIFDPDFRDDYMLYNDSLAVASIDPDFIPYSAQGISLRSYDLNGFPFARPGDLAAGYGKEEDGYYGVSGSLTRQTDDHEYKLGFDFQRWTSRRYGVGAGGLRLAIKHTYPELDAVYDNYYRRGDRSRRGVGRAHRQGRNPGGRQGQPGGLHQPHQEYEPGQTTSATTLSGGGTRAAVWKRRAIRCWPPPSSRTRSSTGTLS